MKIENLSNELFEETIGMIGRMIAGSKSGYCKAYPENAPIFNSNMVIESDEHFTKVWYGDVDLTLDHAALLKISEELGTKVYILYEHDARFEKEGEPRMDQYVACYDASQVQNLQVEIGNTWKPYMELDGNVIKRKNNK